MLTNAKDLCRDIAQEIGFSQTPSSFKDKDGTSFKALHLQEAYMKAKHLTKVLQDELANQLLREL